MNNNDNNNDNNNNNNNIEEKEVENKKQANNHLRHFIDPSFELHEFEGINPIHPNYDHYTFTPESEHQSIRETYIRLALDYFNKWDEVELIRQKYIQLHEMKEKLNYNLLINLGISSDDLLNSRINFLTWLSANQYEITEENRNELEKQLLENETNESIQQKLDEWYCLVHNTKNNNDNKNEQLSNNEENDSNRNL